MKDFDRPTDMRPKLSMYVPNDAPTWMTGIVILGAIIMGTFMFEDSGTHRAWHMLRPKKSRNHGVNPAAPPEVPKS
jgi:hypothetical protein